MSSGVSYTVPNYNGKQPNNTSYIKTFVSGSLPSLWRLTTHETLPCVTPSNADWSQFLPRNLYVAGHIVALGGVSTVSDGRMKRNVQDCRVADTPSICALTPKTFSYVDEAAHQRHYGFLADEVERLFPQLVHDGMAPDDDADLMASVLADPDADADADPMADSAMQWQHKMDRVYERMARHKQVNLPEMIPLLVLELQRLHARVQALEQALSEREKEDDDDTDDNLAPKRSMTVREALFLGMPKFFHRQTYGLW